MSRSLATCAAQATRPTQFWFALVAAIFLAGPIPSALAAITPEGNVDPAGPSVWDNSTTGYVGNASAGTLTVDGGSGLLSSTAYIGYGSGAAGIVNVAGAGSSWTNSGQIYVGYDGGGALSIGGGGSVSSGTFGNFAYIGYSSAATGIVTVDGAGSSWANDRLYPVVGAYGSGTLSITHGGAVSSASGYVGEYAGSSGLITVDGAGSSWTWGNGDYFAVGYGGSGTFAITNGGHVSGSTSCNIGYFQGSKGVVTVDGAGSTWTNSSGQVIDIGCSGDGTLSITHGGTVNSGSGSIGVDSGSTGAVIVDGAGSKWTTDSLTVGSSGSGTLLIANGASVSSGGADIGYNSGSTGVATVDGAGSTWSIDLFLYVGESGGGTLSITGGGSVSVGGPTYVGANAGATGLIAFGSNGGTLTTRSLLASPSQMTGAGTINTSGLVSDLDLRFDSTHGLVQTLTIQDSGRNITLNLDVGSAAASDRRLGAGWKGAGSLTIQDGLQVQSASGYLGYLSGSTGVATVSGPGSTWTNSSVFFVGSGGSGTLTITNGGKVNVGYRTYIGDHSGSTGAVTVDGVGSTWTNSGDIYVGSGGNGTLAIANHAIARNANAYIAFNSGSTGSVAVDGVGSVWTNTGSFYIGDSGSGALSITNGGSVSVAGTTYVGANPGAAGAIDFGANGGTLSTQSILFSPTQLTGAGTIVTHGLVTDLDIRFDASHGLTQTFAIQDSGRNVTVKLDMATAANNGPLGVGRRGAGSLTIRDGLLVQSPIGYLAYESGSTGVATVVGAGSAWYSSGLYVGQGGSGSLSISNGGSVSSGETLIACNAGSTGAVTVDGAGSTLSAFSNFQIGVHGSGTLSIAHGGVVNTFFGGSIGHNSGSNGMVTVDGTGSNLNFTNGQSLIVGRDGSGTLSITGSGTAGGSYCVIGNGSLSTGVVEIDGAGSAWSGSIMVGAGGSGRLSITHGGKASGYGSSIGQGVGSKGIAVIDGAGSIWTNTSPLNVGYYGSGTLSVARGGSVSSNTTSSNGYIGYLSGSTGLVAVDGTGSIWTNTGPLNIGYNGSGTLLITRGGSVSSLNSGNSATYIGYGSGSTGLVAVDGAGSIWTNTGPLYVGYFGGGTLSITHGGSVSVTGTYSNSYLGYSGATAVATVDGAGSTWTNGGALNVGYGGTAALSITGGGSVTAASVTVSNNSLLAIDVGRGSLLKIGSTGSGTITNNGTVRFLASAGVPTDANTTYSPILAGSWKGSSSVYQAVGGTWNTSTHKFTASSVTSGPSGSAIPLELASVQRALVSYNGTAGANWEVGASFLAAASPTDATFTATAIDGAIIDALQIAAGATQSILSGWSFATTGYTVSATNPLYLSFDVGTQYEPDDFKLWHYDGNAWTKYVPSDLTYDGRYASFTAAGLSGYAVTVPEPGTLALLALGLLGLLACARRKRQ